MNNAQRFSLPPIGLLPAIGSLLAVAFVVLAGAYDLAANEPAPRRWLYLRQNLQVTESLPKIEALLRRADKAGYNGVVLADFKLNRLGNVPEHYFRNAEKFKQWCGELGLEIIPEVMPFGASEGILWHDPNLAEGLPCREVPFRVRQGQIALDSENKNFIPGDFEEHKGDAFSGWSYQDVPGKGTFADAAIRHGGKTSLRIENPPGASGNRRVSKTLKVRPWTQYHASVWIRTEGFVSAAETRMFALDKVRTLSHSNLGVKRDQDWTEHHVIFNSLGNSEVQFYIGVWGAGRGKLWIDDASVREEPFVNLVRRPGCPLTVTDDAGQTTFVEGRDFAELRDDKLGRTPFAGSFDVYHPPPKLKLLPDSRIRDGQKLRVGYYHAVTIYDGKIPCSLSEPKVFEICEDQIRRVEKLFAPRTYFLSHDEIRVANWSQQDDRAGLTPGQLLAANMKRCVQMIRAVSPKAKLCVWNDMFDPSHNATNNYYLVNGDWAGSWEGLPKDMVRINWNGGKPEKSLPFFAARGHSQILAGYYDGPPEQIVGWMAAGKGVQGIDGVMYTTWQNNYDDLEKFAEAAWGKSK